MDHTTATFQEGNDFAMLKECTQFIFNSIERSKTLLLVHIFTNVYYIISTHILLVCVNYLTADDLDPEKAAYDLLGFSVILLFPNILLHYFEFQKDCWDIAGNARMLLQQNLMTRFLNYDELHRSEFSDAVFIRCIRHDVHRLVNEGYMKFFYLAEALGKIFFAFVYNVFLAISAGRDSAPMLFTILSTTLFIPVIIAGDFMD